MAINFMEIFKSGKQVDVTEALILGAINSSDFSSLLINNAIDMIAKTVAKCEIKVTRIVNGKREHPYDDVYYKLNVRPNKNETGFSFWRNVIGKLFLEQEALVVILNGELFLAQSFTASHDVINSKTFSNIVISSNGEITSLHRSFTIDEVLYLENKNDVIVPLRTQLRNIFDNLIAVADENYRTQKSPKWRMEIESNMKLSQNGQPITSSEYAESVKHKLNSSNAEMITQPRGMNLELVNSGTSTTSDDIPKLINQAMELTASAFDIPFDVFIGKTTEKSNATNDFVTFACDPIFEIIEDSANATIVSKLEYMKGERIWFDKTKIMHRDLLDCSHSIDKLVAVGFSINQLFAQFGLEPIDEEWANLHHVTKNYTTDYLKGGDENED